MSLFNEFALFTRITRTNNEDRREFNLIGPSIHMVA